MATAAKSQFALEDYIGHSFHPDCDFIDGRLEKRNLGEKEHSRMQRAILAWFLQHAREWSIDPFPEVRVQTSATRYRVADIAVLSLDAPDEQIIQTPPLIVVEILSPEDRHSRSDQRLDDHRKMGVLISGWSIPSRAKALTTPRSNGFQPQPSPSRTHRSACPRRNSTYPRECSPGVRSTLHFPLASQKW